MVFLFEEPVPTQKNTRKSDSLTLIMCPGVFQSLDTMSFLIFRVGDYQSDLPSPSAFSFLIRRLPNLFSIDLEPSKVLQP